MPGTYDGCRGQCDLNPATWNESETKLLHSWLHYQGERELERISLQLEELACEVSDDLYQRTKALIIEAACFSALVQATNFNVSPWLLTYKERLEASFDDNFDGQLKARLEYERIDQAELVEEANSLMERYKRNKEMRLQSGGEYTPEYAAKRKSEHIHKAKYLSINISDPATRQRLKAFIEALSE
jgi:hypothetical protein